MRYQNYRKPEFGNFTSRHRRCCSRAAAFPLAPAAVADRTKTVRKPASAQTNTRMVFSCGTNGLNVAAALKRQ
jgi:hypothetical protein